MTFQKPKWRWTGVSTKQLARSNCVPTPLLPASAAMSLMVICLFWHEAASSVSACGAFIELFHKDSFTLLFYFCMESGKFNHLEPARAGFDLSLFVRSLNNFKSLGSSRCASAISRIIIFLIGMSEDFMRP